MVDREPSLTSNEPNQSGWFMIEMKKTMASIPLRPGKKLLRKLIGSFLSTILNTVKRQPIPLE